MKRAARWFRGLLGRKKTAAPESTPAKEKGKWGFMKSFREREKGDQQQQQLSGEMATPPSRVLEEWKGSYKEAGRPYAAADPAADGEERSKRAIAVAAATAAVADAAVAAAQAAAAVVRLTSSGRRVIRFGGAKREEWAAVKIQATFRGYLARRALRALKGLVKLQALVRGNIVRKQAAETLRCMQALVRVQARARACRALRTETSKPNKGSHPNLGPQTPEKYEPAIQTNAMKSGRPSTLKRNSSKPTSTGAANANRAQLSGWNWLDRWMDERYWDGRETSAKAGNGASTDDEKNAKILEIDTGKPQLNPRRMSNNIHSSFSTLTSDQNSHSFTTVPDTPSKDSTTAQQSILSPTSVNKQQSPLPLRFPTFFEARDFEESPQFYSASSSRPGTTRRGAVTPAKSDCSRSLFGEYPDYPNYMANTESSRAKARSHSAPKQRPEFENNEKSCLIKRVSAHGSSVAAAAAQKSSSLHSKFNNKAYPGSGRLDRLGMPIRI